MSSASTAADQTSPPPPTYAQVTAKTNMMSAPKQGQILKHSIFAAHYIRCFSIGDGNCFFHSLAYAVDYSGYRTANSHTRKNIAIRFRAEIVTEEAWRTFLENRGYTEGEGAPTFADAVDYRSHVGDFVYNFVAHRLGIVIIALKSTDNIFCTRDVESIAETDPIVLLAWINDNHYEAICKYSEDIEPPTAEETTAVSEVFGKFASEEKIEGITQECFTDNEKVRGVFFRRWPVVQNIFDIISHTRSRSK